MKKTVLSVFAISILLSCSNNEEELNQSESTEESQNQTTEQSAPKDGMYPYMNIYGDDSINADGNIVYGTAEEVGMEIDKEVVPQLDSASGRMYTLGPRPVTPIPNIYGEDSISPEGDYTYPPQDTLWIESDDKQE